MNSKDPQRSPKTPRPSRIPLVIALGIVALVVGTYFYYVSRQTDYFERRNLRLLASLTQQLNGAFERQENVFSTWAKARPEERGELLRDFDRTPCETRAAVGDLESKTLANTPGKDIVVRRPVQKKGEIWIEMAWAGEGEPQCQQIAMSKILEPVMNRDIFGAFDTVFIANATGRVMYSIEPSHSTSTLLWASAVPEHSLRHGAVATGHLVMADLGAARERTGWRKYEELALGEFRDAGRMTKVEVADRNYVLFTQPYLFAQQPLVPNTGNAGDKDAGSWLVGGIVTEGRFNNDTRAVSASKVALAIGLCILAICAYPFLQIILKDERQPLTMADVVLVSACSIIGVVILTLTVADWFTYLRLSESADEQLQQFAYKVDRDFHRNLNAAWESLDSMETIWAAREGHEADLVPNNSAIYKNDRVAAYPYFSSFALVDTDGMQKFKATRGAMEPRVSVAGLESFKTARKRETWDASPPRSGGERRPYALEWAPSLNGQVEAVLVKPASGKYAAAAMMTTELIDVRHAVAPPGVAFAIIDEQGSVVFHSDEQRIKREDFFVETEHDRELRAAVLGRTDAYVTTRYWGEDQRMFVHPLKNSPWTLVVMRGKRLVRAINMEALLLTVLGLAFNGLPYLLLIAGVLVMKPWYRAAYLWPVGTRDATYRRVVAVLGLGVVTLLASVYALQPVYLLPILFLMPAQVMLSVYVLLHRQRYRKLSAVALAAWLLSIALLFYVFLKVEIDADLFVSRYPARVRAFLVLSLVYSSIVALDLMSREDGLWQRRVERARDATRRALTEWSYARALAVTVVGAVVYFLPAREILDTGSYLSVGWALIAQLLASIAWVSLERARRADDSPPPTHVINVRVCRVAWWVTTAYLAHTIRVATVQKGESEWGIGGVAVAFAIAAGITFYLADKLLHPLGEVAWKWGEKVRALRPVMYPTSYKVALALMLIIAAVLPAVGYFKIGSRVQQEALIKYAQLRLAASLEDRANHIAELVSAEKDKTLHTLRLEAAHKDAFRYRLSNVWDSLWMLNDAPPDQKLRASRPAPLIAHELLADYIPQYSEDSVAMRQLYTTGSSDALWSWTPAGRLLTLDRTVRFERAAAKLLAGDEPMRRHHMTVSSYVPALFQAMWSPPNTRRFIVSPLTLPSRIDLNHAALTLGDIGYTLFIAVILALGIATLWWIVSFFGERVFVMDVHSPDWAKIGEAGALGTHVFLVRGAVGLADVLNASDANRFVDFKFEDLDTNNKWDAAHEIIDESPSKPVRVLDYEWRVENAPAQRRKLVWLQQVLARGDRSVLMISKRTPQFVEDDAWKAVLCTFVCMYWEDVVRRADLDTQRRSCVLALPPCPKEFNARQRANKYWLDEETEWSSALMRYREGIDLGCDRAQIIDELGERAAPYYDILWTTSSTDEKVLLFHLARYGFVHGKSRRTLRRLIARGLVRRDPNLELLSETFRLYVLQAAQSDNLAAIVKTVEDENVLRSLRVPIFTVILALLLLLFTTQKDLLTATSGLAAALATGLPLLAKVLGVFADRRLESIARV